jgi:hypothetical protein
MKPFLLAPDILAVAPNVMWFESPAKALSDPIRFMAYLMTYGTAQDIAVVRRYAGPDAFREAIESAPPGIIDERSWAYWNIVVGRYPVPPLPRRMLPGED